jgi:hypothetical protein
LKAKAHTGAMAAVNAVATLTLVIASVWLAVCQPEKLNPTTDKITAPATAPHKTGSV